MSDAAQNAADADLTVSRETPAREVAAGRALHVQPCRHCEGRGTRLDERDAGQQVRDERTALGLTSAELARRLKVSSSYLVDLESGRRAWTRARFCRVMAELDRVRAEREADQ